MAAPPSPGGAVAEQERLVALIPVLRRDPLSIEPPPPFSCRPGQSGAEPRGLRADRSSGQQALNPSRLAFVSFSLLLPIPGVGRSIRSRCHRAHERFPRGSSEPARLSRILGAYIQFPRAF